MYLVCTCGYADEHDFSDQGCVFNVFQDFEKLKKQHDLEYVRKSRSYKRFDKWNTLFFFRRTLKVPGWKKSVLYNSAKKICPIYLSRSRLGKPSFLNCLNIYWVGKVGISSVVKDVGKSRKKYTSHSGKKTTAKKLHKKVGKGVTDQQKADFLGHKNVGTYLYYTKHSYDNTVKGL